MFPFRIRHRVTSHGTGHMTGAKAHGKAVSASSIGVHSVCEGCNGKQMWLLAALKLLGKLEKKTKTACSRIQCYDCAALLSSLPLSLSILSIDTSMSI